LEKFLNEEKIKFFFETFLIYQLVAVKPLVSTMGI